MKDHCTKFPEYWYQWTPWKYGISKLKKVYIGDCCKVHDKECDTTVFYTCLKKKNVLGGYMIALVACAVCLYKYGKV